MKLSIAALVLVGANAFSNTAFTSRKMAVTQLNNMAENVGIPCEGECALDCYPNLPASIHPGVLSGEAMMDLLAHAKENGEFRPFVHGGGHCFRCCFQSMLPMFRRGVEVGKELWPLGIAVRVSPFCLEDQLIHLIAFC